MTEHSEALPHVIVQPPALSKQDERRGVLLWFRLARFYNQSIRQTNQHLSQWNMTAAQFDILAQVGGAGRITQQELADKLVVTKGNITQLLVKAEAQGVLSREQQWKTKYVSLTEAGKKLYEEVVPLQEHFQAAKFSSLTMEEQKQFLELLKKLR
ncbi:MAG: MarR family transcriptional regulator [Gorillibacterium sp.]|nr:MarR family transcriptional regulator [Gorillibacterium sp.]